MTYTECFRNFAYVAESNPRIRELAEKHDAGTITEEELTELTDLYDDVFFNPFLLKNFMNAEDDFSEEDEARIKATVQDMINRGVIQMP